MFRTTLGVALSTRFLTASTICQPNSHPVSAKVKEMLLIQQAEKGDRDAQAEIVSKAEKGDPQAQTALGDNYEYGYWVTKDHVEALRWYQKAAEKGDRGAREILGERYSTETE
jgi:TPR repeat protein